MSKMKLDGSFIRYSIRGSNGQFKKDKSNEGKTR